MVQQSLEFKDILVIHFGQLGDVVLGLPALVAIRQRFVDSKITLLIGQSAGAIAKLANVADEYILVDRVALRDGKKLRSIRSILALVSDIRSRRFDLVIDLNSLYETNLLGFLSGAKSRLYENRENRSINWLSNFPVASPREDKLQHHTDRYLAVLEPLGIYGAKRTITVDPPASLLEQNKTLKDLTNFDGYLIGLFVGAGHVSRRWPIEKFVGLAAELARDGAARILVFLGPEERDQRPGLAERFGVSAIVVDEMPLMPFFAMLSRLSIFVCGDTGPMHLAALAGADIVLLSEIGSTQVYRPLIQGLEVIEDRPLNEITVEQVQNAVSKLRRRVRRRVSLPYN